MPIGLIIIIAVALIIGAFILLKPDQIMAIETTLLVIASILFSGVIAYIIVLSFFDNEKALRLLKAFLGAVL